MGVCVPLKLVINGDLWVELLAIIVKRQIIGLFARFLTQVKTSVIYSFLQGTKANFYKFKRNQDFRFKMYLKNS